MWKHLTCVLFTCFILLGICIESTLLVFDFFPSDEALDKYRRSWNPSTHGSLLIHVAETPPKGQLTLSGFAVGQIGDGQYHNTLTTHVSSSPVNTNSVVPGGLLSYGLTEHVSIGAGLPAIYWNGTGPVTGPSSSAGLGDTSQYCSFSVKLQMVAAPFTAWAPATLGRQVLPGWGVGDAHSWGTASGGVSPYEAATVCGYSRNVQ